MAVPSRALTRYDALGLAAFTVYTQAPYATTGTVTLRLSRWYGRVVGDVLCYQRGA